jgi:hypothetical protein
VSIQLILAQYLSGLRERNELDLLLPDLLREMGHNVLSRPQIGVAQAGVDVVSTLAGDDGAEEVYLFIIKFGDVGRGDFYSGKQAIEPSIREAATDFVRNRLPEPLRALRKRLVLVTNGVLKQEVQAGFSALSVDVAERPNCSLELWNADKLTPLIEKYLFDEALLLDTGKSDLRAALAGLEETDTAVSRFVRFLDECFKAAPDEAEQGASTRKKKFLRRAQAACMGWAVLLVWCKSEENLKPGVLAGEYLLLRLWSEAVRSGLERDEAFGERLSAAMLLYLNSLLAYFQRVGPQLASERALLRYRPHRILYAELLFEEMGRLAQFLLLLQRAKDQASMRQHAKEMLIALINEHTGFQLPVFDGQGIDITLVVMALMGESDFENARTMVAMVIDRFILALQSDRDLPVDTDLREDAFSHSVADGSHPREFFETSSLIPALGLLAAALGDEDSLKRLREEAQPLLEGITLERWYPAVELETLTGARGSVASVGVSRALSGFRDTAADEVAAAMNVPGGAASPSDFKWHGTPWKVFPVLSSRMWRHPVPTWFVHEYAGTTSELGPGSSPAPEAAA